MTHRQAAGQHAGVSQFWSVLGEQAWTRGVTGNPMDSPGEGVMWGILCLLRQALKTARSAQQGPKKKKKKGAEEDEDASSGEEVSDSDEAVGAPAVSSTLLSVAHYTDLKQASLYSLLLEQC